MKKKSRKDVRRKRHLRIRRRVSGTAACPRMAIAISGRHMYVQFIDDERAVTLAAVSTSGAGAGAGHNLAAAAELGGRAAAEAAARGIRRVVVDRGGHTYHGRVQALVDAATASGLTKSAEGTDKT